MTQAADLTAAVSIFGHAAKAKLSNVAISGAPEDQLRGPLETLLSSLAKLTGLPVGAMAMVGETSLSDLKTRPDFAVTVTDALVGFIEVKQPGKGADPRKFKDPHDKAQWEKLKSLPNLVYTDGNAFSRWCDGELQGVIVKLDGDVETVGIALTAPATLLPLVADFLQWTPIPPRTAGDLANVTARLCRLLRDEVEEQMAEGSKPLTELAKDWRTLLFPDADDAQFADGYAQAVTFGLLMAKSRGIVLAGGLDAVAKQLGKTNTLIGTALKLLTEQADGQEVLVTSLKTLVRVLDVVDWSKISKGDPEAWLYFYERFLGTYDNSLRKKTGSYYTPPQVVQAMVRLVDDALRSPARFGLPAGFASFNVIVADPAVGSGTFLLGVLRRIADAVRDSEGEGAVAAALATAADRLIGFEIQFGAFAVAQLRLFAELIDLKTPDAPPPKLKLFVTDTLGDPYEHEANIPGVLKVLAQSRAQANAIKAHQPITVVIGNPPYKEKAKGRGGWVEAGDGNHSAPFKDWIAPKSWGVGLHAKHLRNLYVYFWRWAAWKVFGPAVAPPGEAERNGLVCFITVAGFLNGPGFEKMRDDLRRSCDEIWVIDCSPDGHQPGVGTRIFQGVQQPVCIVLASRSLTNKVDVPAAVRFRALPVGPRNDKFVALSDISIDDGGWSPCSDGWRAPFMPMAKGAWATFPALSALLNDAGSGVMPGRTWPIAPDKRTLEDRWQALIGEKNGERKAMLFHPHIRKGGLGDKHVNKVVADGLAGHAHRTSSVSKDVKAVPSPTRYAFRSFDRQWIIPDARLINQPNPGLWRGHSKSQVYLTALMAHAPTDGPAVSFTGLVPDLHHFKGSFGGRVFTLWNDNSGLAANTAPGLADLLTKTHGVTPKPEDVIAYIAAVAAHPGYVTRFKTDLKQPGLRIPLTADPLLFSEAAALGREVVWLHCYGERFADPANDRPAAPPRLPKDRAPTIPKDGAIPSTPGAIPDVIDYDTVLRRLKIGTGFVDNVDQAVWAYSVSGKQVVKQWFSYRGRNRERPIIGDRRPPSPLGELQPDHWLPEYTTDLIDLLNVLGRLVDLEPRQNDLLERICEGSLISADEVEAAKPPPQPQEKKKGSRRKKLMHPDQIAMLS